MPLSDGIVYMKLVWIEKPHFNLKKGVGLDSSQHCECIC